MSCISSKCDNYELHVDKCIYCGVSVCSQCFLPKKLNISATLFHALIDKCAICKEYICQKCIRFVFQWGGYLHLYYCYKHDSETIVGCIEPWYKEEQLHNEIQKWKNKWRIMYFILGIECDYPILITLSWVFKQL